MRSASYHPFALSLSKGRQFPQPVQALLFACLCFDKALLSEAEGLSTNGVRFSTNGLPS